MQIKFSHRYPKLWNQTKAQLLAVRLLDAVDVRNNGILLEYDTYWNNEMRPLWFQELELEYGQDGYYELPKTGKLLQLIFIGDKHIPFCTLRTAKPGKEEYYRKAIGELFDIIVGDASVQAGDSAPSLNKQ